jgi:hypothetical protein
VKHSVSNGKRHVSNVNKRAKMFAVCAWTQIAVFTGRLVNNAFQKECFAKFYLKINKILKESSQKTKKAQNVVFII